MENIDSVYDYGNANQQLSRLYDNAEQYSISKSSPVIIFSDLHIGNGGKNDDFKKNSELFTEALKSYYSPNRYTLVLNGDIEELQKFRLDQIRKQWMELYNVFDSFAEDKRLIKLTGNHDDMLESGLIENRYGSKQAAKLKLEGIRNPLFIFHGHQASWYYQHMNKLNEILLRYIVNPSGIGNISKKYDYARRMKLEKRIYDFSKENKLISIIGHTHRPLFESLSRVDSLRFMIESLLRAYRNAPLGKRAEIAARIHQLKHNFDTCSGKNRHSEPVTRLYSGEIPVPCMFNSGCAIGKRGITGIEINDGRISLVHWFDSRVSNRFIFSSEMEPKKLSADSPLYRVVLREDSLHYINDSIQILGGIPGSEDVIIEKPVSIFSENEIFSDISDISVYSKQNLTLRY